MIRIKKISKNSISVKVEGIKEDLADELLYIASNYHKIAENVFHDEFKQLDKKYKYNRKF